MLLEDGVLTPPPKKKRQEMASLGHPSHRSITHSGQIGEQLWSMRSRGETAVICGGLHPTDSGGRSINAGMPVSDAGMTGISYWAAVAFSFSCTLGTVVWPQPQPGDVPCRVHLLLQRLFFCGPECSAPLMTFCCRIGSKDSTPTVQHSFGVIRFCGPKRFSQIPIALFLEWCGILCSPDCVCPDHPTLGSPPGEGCSKGSVSVPQGGGGGRRNRHLDFFFGNRNGGFSGFGSAEFQYYWCMVLCMLQSI